MLQTAVARLRDLVPALAAGEAHGGKVNRRLIILIVALATMVAYFVPFLLLGNNAYITIQDNLDDEFLVKYLLVATGKALVFDGSATVQNIMGGLPRAALPSGLNVSVLLFYVLPPVWAYIVNYILVHMIAFVGMFLLLRKYFLTHDDDYGIVVAISLCFFFIPYYTTHGLTVGGQPLLAYAFLNIRGGQPNWKDYFIILLFPLWSNIALIAPFAVTVLALILVVDWLRSRRLNKRFLISIMLFAAAYIALEYQMIDSFVMSNRWVSHRTVFHRWTDFDLSSNIKRALRQLFKTQYHSGLNDSFSTLPVIIATGGALALLIRKKRRAGLLEVMAVGIVVICLENGFYDWIVRWLGGLLPALHPFNASRFFFLLPLLWMLLFATSLKELQRIKWSVPIAWCLILSQAFAIARINTEYADNLRLLVGKFVYEPNFRRFYAQDLFAEIDKFIDRPKDSYRVVSIGLPPAAALFNGFFTLDGYVNTYPLSYKLQFRQIIWKELDKDAFMREYFDGWGNQCYVFSSELKMNDICEGANHYVLHNLELDTDQLRAMGGEYVISAADIENSGKHGLRLEREFSSPGSFWHLFLYYVLPPGPAHVASVEEPQNANGEKQAKEARKRPGGIKRGRKVIYNIPRSQRVGSGVSRQLCSSCSF